jgi:hypothetical protein
MRTRLRFLRKLVQGRVGVVAMSKWEYIPNCRILRKNSVTVKREPKVLARKHANPRNGIHTFQREKEIE